MSFLWNFVRIIPWLSPREYILSVFPVSRFSFSVFGTTVSPAQLLKLPLSPLGFPRGFHPPWLGTPWKTSHLSAFTDRPFLPFGPQWLLSYPQELSTPLSRCFITLLHASPEPLTVTSYTLVPLRPAPAYADRYFSDLKRFLPLGPLGTQGDSPSPSHHLRLLSFTYSPHGISATLPPAFRPMTLPVFYLSRQ